MTEQKQKPKRRWLFVVGAGVIVVVCGCLGVGVLTQRTPTDQPAAQPADTSAGAVATSTPQRAAPQEPTNTPAPPDTPEPPATPAPTETPAPTDTPPPTDTPAPPPTPTPAPEPIVLAGDGDTILNLEKWPGLALLRVQGNEAGRHFALTLYGAEGNMIDIPINTTDPYQGLIPLDFNGTATTRIEVNATGPWRIEALPLSAARSVALPGDLTGTGDEVIALVGTPDLGDIRGNQAGRHFAVLAFNEGGQMLDIPVNTTDPYEGQVILPRQTRFLQITARDEWSLAVSAAP